MINRIKAIIQLYASKDRIEIDSVHAAVRTNDKTFQVRNSKTIKFRHKNLSIIWESLWRKEP